MSESKAREKAHANPPLELVPLTARAASQVVVPMEIIDGLVGLGLQTAPGANLWSGFCAGHPSLTLGQSYVIHVQAGRCEPGQPPKAPAG
jgi:hypothetical protein